MKSITPTIGFQIHTLSIGAYNLQVWDIGGQSTLRPFWENYFDSTDVLLWCVDIFAKSRFQESCQELCKLLSERDRLGLRCAIIIIVNKIDLLGAEDDPLVEQVCNDLVKLVEDQITCGNTSDSTNFFGHVTALPCSALTGTNLSSLQEVIEGIYSKYD